MKSLIIGTALLRLRDVLKMKQNQDPSTVTMSSKDDNEASCSSICSRDSLPIQSIHLNIYDLLGGHKVRHAGMVKWPFEIKKSETSPKRPINKKSYSRVTPNSNWTPKRCPWVVDPLDQLHGICSLDGFIWNCDTQKTPKIRDMTRWRWSRRWSTATWCSATTPTTGGATPTMSPTTSPSRRRTARRTSGRTASSSTSRLPKKNYLILSKHLPKKIIYKTNQNEFLWSGAWKLVDVVQSIIYTSVNAFTNTSSDLWGLPKYWIYCPFSLLCPFDWMFFKHGTLDRFTLKNETSVYNRVDMHDFEPTKCNSN